MEPYQTETQAEAMMAVLVVGLVAGEILQVELQVEVIVGEVRNSMVMVMAAEADPTMLVHRKSTKAESMKAMAV